jgi:hypothetical protein
MKNEPTPFVLNILSCRNSKSLFYFDYTKTNLPQIILRVLKYARVSRRFFFINLNREKHTKQKLEEKEHKFQLIKLKKQKKQLFLQVIFLLFDVYVVSLFR